MSKNLNKTILVTGHAGFIGSHLTEKLLDSGFKIIGVDDFNDFYNPERKKENVKEFLKHKNFKQYQVNILDQKKLNQIFDNHKIDLVIHLAARAGVRPSLANPKLYWRVNVKGTNNLLDLANKYKIKQFIFASSSSVYGNQEKVPFTETDRLEKPVSPYAASKQEAEKLCRKLAAKSGMKMTILRFFTVYGPKGRPDMAPYLFTKNILTGKTISRYGDGSSSRDYTYIDDIVDGLIRAINQPLAYEIINLGNNQPVSLNQFISLIEKLIGKKALIQEKPRHPADVRQTYADITKAKKLLNWQPKTDLETGMKKFIDWFLKDTSLYPDNYFGNFSSSH